MVLNNSTQDVLIIAFVDYNYSLPKSIISLVGTFRIVTISIIFEMLLITSPIF